MASTPRELVAQGYAARREGRLTEACALYEEAVAIYRTLDDPLRLAHTIRHVGDILHDQGRFSDAQPHYAEALEIYRRQESVPPLDLANAVKGFAKIKEKLGEPEAAKSLWLEAREVYAEVDAQPGVDESEARLAILNADLSCPPHHKH